MFNVSSVPFYFPVASVARPELVELLTRSSVKWRVHISEDIGNYGGMSPPALHNGRLHERGGVMHRSYSAEVCAVIVVLFAVVGSVCAAGPATTAPSPISERAHKTIAALRSDLSLFRISLQFWGVGPIPNMGLSVKPFPGVVEISPTQADRIIDCLAAAGFFDQAGDVSMRRRVAPVGCATLTVFGAGELELNLGWDYRTLRNIDRLRTVLDGDAAKAADAVLKALAPHRKVWDQQAEKVQQAVQYCKTHLAELSLDVRFSGSGDQPGGGFPSLTLSVPPVKQRAGSIPSAVQITGAQAAAVADALAEGRFFVAAVQETAPITDTPHYTITLGTPDTANRWRVDYAVDTELLGELYRIARALGQEGPADEMWRPLWEAVRVGTACQFTQTAQVVGVTVSDDRPLDGVLIHAVTYRLLQPGTYWFTYRWNGWRNRGQQLTVDTEYNDIVPGQPAPARQMEAPDGSGPRVIVSPVEGQPDTIVVRWQAAGSPEGPDMEQGWSLVQAGYRPPTTKPVTRPAPDARQR